MEKPQVRIIENQAEITSNADVSISERNALLAKYGFKNEPINFNESNHHSERGGLTFEEMIEREEEKIRSRQNESKREKIDTYSIDRDRVQFYDSKYSTLEDNDSFGFEIKIVSDMKIPKY